MALMASRKDPDSKRSKGVERHLDPRMAFHYPPEMQAALNEYLRRTRPKPDKSEIMRTALADFLAKHGLWPWPPPKD